jgi:very-short-patch-repair endonuclease
MFKCNSCNIEFKSYKGLQTHNSKTHKIPGVETYVNFHYNGEWPVCKCGCMEKLNFQGGKFGEYIRGHKARVSGGFYSAEGLKKSAATRKDQFASGERVQWNKGKKYTEEQLTAIQESAKNPERRKKISESLTGKKKSPEHIAKIKADRQKYWGIQENRDAQRVRRSEYMSNYLIKNETKLEKEFQIILNSLGISYIFQYTVNGYNYDFYIPAKNILIEVDGDWWHCNPNLGIEPIYESQKHTIEHDLTKNKIALDNGYTLIRFWEHDVVNKRFECISKLMLLLS